MELLGRIENPALDFWYHICLDLDTSKDTVSAAVNGAVVGQDVDLGGEGMAAEMAKELKNKLVVGKWNYTFTGEEEQFVGMVTNLEFFTSTKDHDLATLTQDLCNAEGDFLSWEEMMWKVDGEVAEEEVSSETVCHQTTSYNLLLTEPMSQEDAVTTCNKLGHGKMMEAATREEIDKLVGWVETMQATKNCSYIWTPYSDKASEDTFVNLENGEEQKNIAWKPKQPNGASTENSLRIEIASKLIEDAEEDNHKGVCFVCTIQKGFTARLRGGCGERELERLFYLENDSLGGVRYIGWMGSIISYNLQSEVWQIRHYSSPKKIFGNITASPESLSLGSHEWNFTDETDQ